MAGTQGDPEKVYARHRSGSQQMKSHSPRQQDHLIQFENVSGDNRQSCSHPSASISAKTETSESDCHHRPGGKLRNRPTGREEQTARMRVVELFRVVLNETVVKQKIKAIRLPGCQNRTRYRHTHRIGR